MKKVTKLTWAFIPVTFLCGYLGSISLRWHQLQLLYRIMDQFFVGIGTTLGAVTILATIVGFFIWRVLHKMDKISIKIRNDEPITDKDRVDATKGYNQVRYLILGENIFGFVIGNGVTV